MNHSSIGLFLFSLFLFIHIRIQHGSAFAVLDRSYLFSRADRCVLKYLENVKNTKIFHFLPYLVDRCAVNQYFKLEKYGSRSENGKPIYNSFPLFKSHLEQCTTFVFFGTTSESLSSELEILDSTEFQLIGCDYLIIDDKKHGLDKKIQTVDELNSEILIDLLKSYEKSGNLIFEHLFIGKMTDLKNFYGELLKLREKYRVMPCQIIVRFPKIDFSSEELTNFSMNVLKSDPYTLMNIKNDEIEDFIEFYLFASAEYHCMMRYF